VDGGCEVGLESCQVCFVDGCWVVGKGEPFLEAELDFMDGWFEGEAGVDLAVRVAVLRCMCWRSYL
jgi:hypothetical protein